MWTRIHVFAKSIGPSRIRSSGSARVVWQLQTSVQSKDKEGTMAEHNLNDYLYYLNDQDLTDEEVQTLLRNRAGLRQSCSRLLTCTFFSLLAVVGLIVALVNFVK